MSDTLAGPGGVAVVILHYGRPERTARLYEQLLQSDPDWREAVRVLDNAAPEPFAGAWRRLEVNLHWAGALGWAVRHFTAQGATHLWFLNNDCYFATKAPHLARAWARLQRLEQTLGRVGIYSPSALTNPYHPQMVQNAAFQYRTVAMLDGIAPLFNLACLADIGGLDVADNPYGYGVDIWTSLQARARGWHLVVDQQVAVRHVYHSTAREQGDYLARAATAEAAYLERRLGAEYRWVIEARKREFRDVAEM